MVGTVMKYKVGELEEDIREGFSRRLRKEMTGVVQEVVGNRSYSVRFQDCLEKEIFWKRRYLLRFQDSLVKYMSPNQLTIVVVRSEVEEEIDLREVEMIPEVREELGCYHWIYISLHFIK